MGVTGHEGADPGRVGTSLIDMGTGMWAVIGVLAALRRRDATGQGGRIDVSLYETALGWMTYHVSGFLASGRDPKRPGTRSRSAEHTSELQSLMRLSSAVFCLKK